MEAIILAGGKGTRLRSVVSDAPKPLAPVGGIPFLMYLLRWLEHCGVSRVVLSVGYKSEAIKRVLGRRYNSIEFVYSEETAPLGTGGAIAQALRLCDDSNVTVINGDTFFDVDLAMLLAFHTMHDADVTLALRRMSDFDRYGTVLFSEGRVNKFCDRSKTAQGYINGGIYMLNVRRVARFLSELPPVFSFETDFLSAYLNRARIFAQPFEGNFIDIGIPEDYIAAQTLLPAWVRL